MAGVGVRDRSGAASLTGHRETNQDAFFLSDSVLGGGPALGLIAVADGMGGHDNGQVASQLAVEYTARAFRGAAADPEMMRRAFLAADETIRASTPPSPDGLSMGTTLTFAVVRRGEALVGHVGDSRAYLYHGGQLSQITSDHSRVGQLVRSGVISEDEALGHPESNVLEQALGVGNAPEVDVYRVGLGPNDVLLLSSDGLHGTLSRLELEAVLREQLPLQATCDRLAELAIEKGSDDNVTVITWRYPAEVGRTATIPGLVPRRVPGSPPPPSGRRPRVDRRLIVSVAGYLVGFAIGFGIRCIT